MQNKSGLLSRLDTKAFTLIELLVVVLIIGILAAVALPQYQMAVAKSRFTQAKAMVRALINAQEAYFLANGSYALSFDELSVDTPPYVREELDEDSRPKRVFKWGTCKLWNKGGVDCRFNVEGSSLAYSASPPSSAVGSQFECLVYTDNLSALGNRLCKSETGLSTPSQQGTGYVRWIYP